MLKKVSYIAGSSLLLSCFVAGNAVAKVSEEKAAEIGKSLTWSGAERAGNADGTIPAYTGGFDKNLIPTGWKPGMSYTNPFPEDKVLITINASNVDQHMDKLAPGTVAMIKTYPDTYYLNVYKTRRTAGVTESAAEDIKYNATHATLAEGGSGVLGMHGSTPFPIPNEGVEAVWNHVIRWRGGMRVVQDEATFAPQVDGSYAKATRTVNFFFNPEFKKGGPRDDIIFFYTSKVNSPSRLTGEIILLHETANQSDHPRIVWKYYTGQRRVRRAPDAGHDSPSADADGLFVSDQVDGINGAINARFEWEIVGKQEMYIPYNNFDMNQPNVSYDDLIQKGHINPKWSRWELHRVWVVKGKLKQGQRHVYGSRVLYIDEDSWQVAVHDMYDVKDNLWRTMELFTTIFWDANISWVQGYTTYDILAKRYYVRGLVNEEKPYVFDQPGVAGMKGYTPAALRRMGRR
ncbi:MAG: DUF1329 domain-containing protein [Pseudomonadales bacterium]|nr:DUF1329 domain-containing protein [Pseudomonadales bacterium]